MEDLKYWNECVNAIRMQSTKLNFLSIFFIRLTVRLAQTRKLMSSLYRDTKFPLSIRGAKDLDKTNKTNYLNKNGDIRELKISLKCIIGRLLIVA